MHLCEQERKEQTETMACCVDMNKASVHDWAHFVNLHSRQEPFHLGPFLFCELHHLVSSIPVHE